MISPSKVENKARSRSPSISSSKTPTPTKDRTKVQDSNNITDEENIQKRSGESFAEANSVKYIKNSKEGGKSTGRQ